MSPDRTSVNKQHRSIDDSHLNLDHIQSTPTDMGQVNNKNRTTYAGFYGSGKIKGDSKIYQRVSPNYATQTTIPGSSVNNDADKTSRFKDFKSPSQRFPQNSHRGNNQSGNELLPRLENNRHHAHSVTK